MGYKHLYVGSIYTKRPIYFVFRLYNVLLGAAVRYDTPLLHYITINLISTFETLYNRFMVLVLYIVLSCNVYDKVLYLQVLVYIIGWPLKNRSSSL